MKTQVEVSDTNGYLYKIEEWKNLRDEISQKQQLNHRIIFSTLGLNFLLYSYILVQKQEHAWLDAFIALLPAFFVGIANYWHLKNDHSAYRISIYIKNFLETDSPCVFNWETTLKRYINVSLKKTRKELSLLSATNRGFRNFISSVWNRAKMNAEIIANFTGIPLLLKTSNEIPREVNLVLNTFYYISPLIATFILVQVDSVPAWLEHDFFYTFLIFLSFSWIIYCIWAFTIIKIGQREINILHLVANRIEEVGLDCWKKEIDEWQEAHQ